MRTKTTVHLKMFTMLRTFWLMIIVLTFSITAGHSEQVNKWWLLSTLENSASHGFIQKQKPFFDPATAECYLRNKMKTDIYNCNPLMNDPNFMQQWYIVPRPEPQFGNEVTVDLGILDVWIKYKHFGQDVVVVVNDDGFEIQHPDLKSNYDSNFGWDFCDGQDTPNANPPWVHMQATDDHGTKVAGVIAMTMNNGICGVGVAPHVTLGAARVLCKGVISIRQNILRIMVDALLRSTTGVHITVNSYGSNRIDGPHLPVHIPYYLYDAFEKTASEGRGGLGTIHVFGAGNLKEHGLSCSFHIFGQSIYTIVAAGTNPWGGFTLFSERCAAVMVAAPTSTSDPKYFSTTRIHHQCTNQFGGTSAVAPLVAGIIALTLNANPNLTWRDVQHLLAYTCSKEQLVQSSFILNDAGFYVSHDFGFGLINALHMVEKSKHFKSVPPLHTCTVSIHIKRDYFSSADPFELSFKTDACWGNNGHEVNYLEHVQLYVKMSFTGWRNLRIDLASPKNTVANLLAREPSNDSTSQQLEWIFDSVMTWGESPRGTWTINIYDETGRDNNGYVYALELKLYGTETKPFHYH